MELRDLTRDLFLFAATFRERLERGQAPHVNALADEVKTLFADMDARARQNPALSARYDKARYALVALVDEIIVTSTWSQATEWPVLEMTYYQTSIAGDHVYELIKGLTAADLDLIEVYFTVLALGFRGKHAFDEDLWAEQLLQLYRMLPPGVDTGKITPEAYRVINRKAQRLDPLFSLGRGILIFLLCLVLLVVFYQFVWWDSVKQAKAQSEAVRENLNDDDLRRALEEAVQ